MANLVRWDPFTELMPSEHMLDRLFGNRAPFAWKTNGETEFGYFPMDVAETADGYEITASLPGLKPEEVEIQIHGTTVTIKGEMKSESPPELEKDKAYLRRERRYGAFSRSLTLPTDLDAEKATAVFEHGVLKLRLPKSEAMKPKTVKVVGSMA